MKRYITAALAVLAVTTGAGLKLANQPESSAALQDVSLAQHSEHASPGSTNSLARIRIRLSPNDLGFESRATSHSVPHVSLAGG